MWCEASFECAAGGDEYIKYFSLENLLQKQTETMMMTTTWKSKKFVVAKVDEKKMRENGKHERE